MKPGIHSYSEVRPDVSGEWGTPVFTQHPSQQFHENGNQKYRGMFETQNPETWQVLERLVSTLEQMQVPNGTRPRVWKSKRPLLIVMMYNRMCICGKDGVAYGKVKMPFNCSPQCHWFWKAGSHVYEISVTTKNYINDDFNRSLTKLYTRSLLAFDKTIIIWTHPGVPCKSRNKNIISRKWFNVDT